MKKRKNLKRCLSGLLAALVMITNNTTVMLAEEDDPAAEEITETAEETAESESFEEAEIKTQEEQSDAQEYSSETEMEEVYEEPAAEEQSYEEPVIEEQPFEEPAAEEIISEVQTEEPVIEEQPSEEPVAEEIISEVQTEEEPVIEKQSSEEPAAEESSDEPDVQSDTAAQEANEPEEETEAEEDDEEAVVFEVVFLTDGEGTVDPGSTSAEKIEDLKDSTAAAADNWEFDGWYVQNELLTTAERITYSAYADRLSEDVPNVTISARFRQKISAEEDQGDQPEPEVKPQAKANLLTAEENDEEETVYTVTFTAEGNDPVEIHVNEGETIGDQMPADPEKEGFDFEGWFEGETEITSSTTVTSDIEAAARFKEIEKHTVTFTADGETVATVEIEHNTAIGDQLPEGPEKEESVFAGWFSGETEITAETIVDADIEAEAVYEAAKHTVTFISDGETVATVEIGHNEKIGSRMPEDPEKEGFRFISWISDGTEISADTAVDADITAEAQFEEIIHYTVSFVVDGTDYHSVTVENGESVGDQMPEDPNLEGQRFDGWFAADGSQFTKDTAVERNMTVEAALTRIHTVVFTADGAAVETRSLEDGSVLGTLPEAPVKTGFRFVSWQISGSDISAEMQVHEDLNIEALYEEVTYTVTYYQDAEGTTRLHQQGYKANETINSFPEEPFTAGYYFSEWKDQETGAAVTLGTAVTRDMILVPEFVQIVIYEAAIEYWYENPESGEEVTFSTNRIEFETGDLPITVQSPESAYVSEEVDAGHPVYYPEETSVEITEDITQKEYDLEDGVAKIREAIRVRYIPRNTSYIAVYKVKTIDGSDYEEYSRETRDGVLGTAVSAPIKTLEGFTYEKRDEAVLETEGQEVSVFYTRNTYTLSFDTKGGDYAEAVSDVYGSEIALPETVRKGYEFQGWYKDEAYTEAAGNAGASYELTANETLYAKWEEADTRYTVVYMIENADDDGYSFLGTVELEEKTGTEVSFNKTEADRNAPSSLDRTNFTFKDSTTETVKSDGSTVVTIRYSRNVYTITWNGSDYYYRGGYQYHRTVSGRASITAKYGADISSEWHTKFNVPYEDYCWNFGTNNDEKFTSLDRMPSGNKTINRWYYSTEKTQTLNYWYENYESATTKNYNGHTYGLFKSVTVRYNYLYDTDYPEYDGYTKGGWVRSDRKRNLTDKIDANSLTADFYYNAKSYPLTFYNYDGTLIRSYQITLNSDISSYLTGNVPEAPAEGAEWEGWYTDSEHTSAYAGGTKMPAGLVLYGNFKMPVFRFTFHDELEGDIREDIVIEDIAYGTKAEAEQPEARTGYTFLGWYTSQDGNTLYDFEKPVEADTTVYAHWTAKNVQYTVRYLNKETEEPVYAEQTRVSTEYKVGTEVTEKAIEVPGMLADESEKTLKLTDSDAENVITFLYTERAEEITYKVEYVLQSDHSVKVAETAEKTVLGSVISVKETAASVNNALLREQGISEEEISAGYHPVESVIEHTFTAGENVITFEYVSYSSAVIEVNYLDMDGNTVQSSVNEAKKLNETYSVATSVSGYTFDHLTDENGESAAVQITVTENVIGQRIIRNVYLKKNLTITAASRSFTYDGNEHKPAGTDFTVSGLRSGDSLSVSFSGGGITEPGSITVKPCDAVITGPASGSDYYHISYVAGTFTVTKASLIITVTGSQITEVYDGNEHTAGFQITASGDAASAFDVNRVVYAGGDHRTVSRTDVGTDMIRLAGMFSLDAAYTKMFKATFIISESISVTITPALLKVYSDSNEKQYDGTPLTARGTRVEGLQNGETLPVTAVGSQTEVGWSWNDVEFDWDNATAKESNYTFEWHNGTLTVTKGTDNEVTPEPGDDSETMDAASKSITVVYDGQSHTVSGSATKEGSTIEYSVDGGATWSAAAPALTDVGEAEFSIRATNPKYEDVVKDGYKLKVTPREVTITTGSDEKPYDGTELTNAEAGIANLAGEETATVTATGSQTEIGSSSNTYSIVWGTAKESNYTIKENLGTLTVTKGTDNDVTPEPGDDSETMDAASKSITVVYDGQSHTVSGSATKEGSTIEYSVDGGATWSAAAPALTDVGEAEFSIRATNPKYEDVVKDGYKLKVTPREVTVTADSKSKVYGENDPELTAKTEGTIGEDTVTYEMGREEGEDVGEYSITPAGKEAQGNYTVKYVSGTLTITAAEIIIPDPDDPQTETSRFSVSGPEDTVYNGLEQKQPVTITDNDTGKVLGSADCTITYSTDTTNAGTVTVTITGTGNYSGTVTRTYRINPAELAVTTADGTKAYDGTALAGTGASIAGLVNNETATVTATGSQTEVGSSANTYSIVWGTAKASNYTITENLGTLTVTAAVTPVPDDTDPTPIPGPAPEPIIIPDPVPDPVPAIVPVVPVPVPAPVPAVVPADEPEAEIIDEPETPLAPPAASAEPEIIDEPETPLAPPVYWALINLISAIITALLGLGMAITFLKKKKDDDDDNDEDKPLRQADEEENEEDENKRRKSKLLGLIPGIASPIIFLLTEDMSAMMRLTDKWTLLMVVLAVLNLVLAFVTRNKKKDDEDKDQEASAAA